MLQRQIGRQRQLHRNVSHTVSRLPEDVPGQDRPVLELHVRRNLDASAGREQRESYNAKYAGAGLHQSDSISVRFYVAGKFCFCFYIIS